MIDSEKRSYVTNRKKYWLTFGLNSASCGKTTCGTCKPLALLPHPFCCLQWRMLVWEWWAGRMKRNGLSSRLGTMLSVLHLVINSHGPSQKGSRFFYFFWKLAWIYVQQKPTAGRLVFVSFFCICVWKTVEYFNQYSYRNWRGLVLSDSMNSLSGQIWWWIYFYMHSGEGASASSLAWLGAWLQMGGLQTNLITSGFAWNWFPCKDTELLCASLMAFLSSLSLFSFSPFCLPWKHLDRCQSYSR